MAAQGFPDDENGRILSGIQARGVDLSVPRRVDFSLVFQSEAYAVGFAAEASKVGFNCEIREFEPDDGPGWDLMASKVMAPGHTAITDAELQLADMARAFDGESDGWGFMAEPNRG